ncbi:MAG TPA: aminodeoxychorismate/anthranilate synthase component II [Phycisphaerae bacterium]|nr:aminodeoxychorismate/anthranilate synthase component II [Phycisphaerae bacterium]HPS52237.1 aminodeoxychorismate/anthranilate synthase component II [Phycisphaerae bacterium]
MIIMIDNYDSFTYNLVQYLRQLGAEVEVYRNDEITVEEIAARDPAGIVISPGPSIPQNAGISVDVVKYFAGKIPLLGVCLGHQAIGYAFGANIVHARHLMHGKTSNIDTDGKGVFAGIKGSVQVMRYHSLAIEEATLSKDFEITARADDGEIMGVRHRTLPVEGVQFHPESIMTPAGKRMLRNFLKQCGEITE